MNPDIQRIVGLVLLAVLRFGATEGDSYLCAHRDARPTAALGGSSPYSSSSSRSSASATDDLGVEVQEDNLTMRCNNNIYCFTLWTSDANNRSKVNVLKQGCWIGDPNSCLQGQCVSSMAPKNNSHFCCCSGDLCNLNFTDGYDPLAHTTTPFIPSKQVHGVNSQLPDVHTTPPFIPRRPLQDSSYKIKTVIISLVSVFSVAFVIIWTYFGYRMCTKAKHPSIELLHPSDVPPVQPEFDMDDLKLCNILSKGRYAEVWKGRLGDRDVAVKIYTHYREYYNNECTLYRLPFMDHEGLVRFYGADERITQEGTAQLMIVMTYMPLGSLCSYLKNNNLDWPTMVGMAYSVAKALSHLHTDIQKGDQFKPVLAHRDLNTRNILVRSDLTCVIADLGFAVATAGSKLIKKGHAEIAEQSSLTDVGTLRYMAPELLDGAVNLRDCEASLKQIDIYALGLVLWEVSLRCVDLYQGAPLPEYAPPFQAEVGANPTFEEMQMLVVRGKKRPKFPEVWKETNQAIRSLKETIEECWDADAEARLTALCVEERLSDLPNLWAHEIKHRGMTPTLNAMININETSTTTGMSTTTSADKFLMTSGHTQHLQLPASVIASSHPATHTSDGDSTSTTATAPLLVNGYLRGGELSRSPSVSATSRSWPQETSTTTETLLPLTPQAESVSLPLPPTKVKSSNLNQEQNSAVLRPHTGRNPTVERNTHKRSDEELRVSGNTLVTSYDSDTQSSPPLSVHHSHHQAPATSSSSADSPPDYMSDGPETSLVQNDALSHQNPPIPYVQNQVHGNGEVIPAGRPKVANTASRSYPTTRGESSLRDKLSRLIRPKELGLRLSSFSLFGSGGGGSGRHSRHDYSRAEDMEVEDFRESADTNFTGQLNGHHPHHASNLVNGYGSNLDHNLSHHHSNINQGYHSNLGHSNIDQGPHSDLGQGHSNLGRRSNLDQGHHSNLVQGHYGPNLQPIHTEVRIQNGSAITRPTNLMLASRSNPASSMAPAVSMRRDRPHQSSDSTCESSAFILARSSMNGGPGMKDCSQERPHAESVHSSEGPSTRDEPSSLSRQPPSRRERFSSSSISSKGSSASAKDNSSSRSSKDTSQRSSLDDVFTETVALAEHLEPAEQPQYPENRLRFAEVGVAKLHIPAVIQHPVRKLQGHSKSTSELLHLRPRLQNSDSCWQETELSQSACSQDCGDQQPQKRRPNSLSLKGRNLSTGAKFPPAGRKSSSKPEVAGGSGTTTANASSSKHKLSAAPHDTGSVPPQSKGSEHKGVSRKRYTAGNDGSATASLLLKPDGLAEASEKIRRRVKTPVIPSKKNARLSLYDDRLMSSESDIALGRRHQLEVDRDMRKSSTSSKLTNNLPSSISSRQGCDDQSAHGDSAHIPLGHPSHNARGESAMSVSDSNICV